MFKVFQSVFTLYSSQVTLFMRLCFYPSLNLQQNDMTYTNILCQKPEIDWIWVLPDATAFFGSRLTIKPLSYEPPLINSPCPQYKLILVWRGFTKTVPCIKFCHNIFDEILLLILAVVKHLRVFEGL